MRWRRRPARRSAIAATTPGPPGGARTLRDTAVAGRPARADEARGPSVALRDDGHAAARLGDAVGGRLSGRAVRWRAPSGDPPAERQPGYPALERAFLPCFRVLRLDPVALLRPRYSTRLSDATAYSRRWRRCRLYASCPLPSVPTKVGLLNPKPALEMWRGGGRSNISVAAPFVWRCLTGSAVAPFPHPAHRTGQADLPHPALGQDVTPSPTTGRDQAGSGVRARSARKGARVDKLRPCVARPYA